MPVVDERRRHVRAAARPAPDDGIAAGLASGQRQIAASRRPDHEDWTLWRTAAGHDEQSPATIGVGAVIFELPSEPPQLRPVRGS